MNTVNQNAQRTTKPAARPAAKPAAKPADRLPDACTLIGNVGTAPELRFTPSGKAVVNFRFAAYAGTTQTDQGKEKVTEWFSIAMWGDLAEKANAEINQGMRLKLSGNAPTIRTWQGNDQQTRYQHEMTVWSYEIQASQPEMGVNQA